MNKINNDMHPREETFAKTVDSIALEVTVDVNVKHMSLHYSSELYNKYYTDF